MIDTTQFVPIKQLSIDDLCRLGLNNPGIAFAKIGTAVDNHELITIGDIERRSGLTSSAFPAWGKQPFLNIIDQDASHGHGLFFFGSARGRYCGSCQKRLLVCVGPGEQGVSHRSGD